MKYRKFGNLDWQVSVLGFGCMRLPVLDGISANIDQMKTTQMIRHAIDAGVNYVDTAYVYHHQNSETALGKALENGYRERVRIATKLPVWLVTKPTDFDKMLDEQLTRLQTDVIDFYLMHALDKHSWKTVRKLNLLGRAEAAVADGRIRYIGFSFHDDLETFKNIVAGYDNWTFCQIQYNYMDTEFQAGTEGLHYAQSKGLGVVIMEPLRGGKLARDLPTLRPIWLSAVNKRKPVDWAFQWLWSQKEISVVLSGMSTLEQVKENLESADASKPDLLKTDELEIINRVRDIVEGMSPIPCTQCDYCMPCPNGVNIPLNFGVYNRIVMYEDLKRCKFEYDRRVMDDEKAEQCIQCDECLPKCPQNIPISSWMPVIADVLGNNQPFVASV